MPRVRTPVRSQVLTFMIALGAILAGVLLIYWQRTGALTIFGDQPVAPGTLEVKEAVDLQKGATAGDGGAVVTDGALTLRKDASGYTSRGTARFDVGNPQILHLFRLRPVLSGVLAPNTATAFSFAGSVDGTSFGTLGAAQTLTSDPANDTVDLTTKLPVNSRFVRIVLTLSTTDSLVTPTINGFTLDYELADQGTSSTSSANPLLINGTLAGSTEGTTATTKRSSRLIATGSENWLTWVLAALGAIALTALLSTRRTNP